MSKQLLVAKSSLECGITVFNSFSSTDDVAMHQKIRLHVIENVSILY